MNYYTPCQEKNVHIYGRHFQNDPLYLFWTGSGIEFITDGAACSIEVEADYDTFEQWIRIELEDYSLIRMPLHKGITTVDIYRGMEKGVPKKIRLFKEVQAMPDDKFAVLKVHRIITDGTLLPLKPFDYKLEFVGDSITSGEGLAGARNSSSWVSSIFSTNGHYGIETAKKMNADIRIVSQSGWGVYSAWDNNIYGNIPKYYDMVCGVVCGEEQIAAGAKMPYDFADWKADAVVINLGTNDMASFDQPGWTDADGTVYKQSRKEDGSPDEDSIERFSSAMRAFLENVRSKNRDAYILWIYGMINSAKDRGLEPVIQDVIAQYQKETADYLISYMPLPALLPEWVGAREHPGPLSHQAAAEVISRKLSEVLH